MRPLQFLIVVLWLTASQAADAGLITRFSVVESSPASWVARGLQDYTVSPESGWAFAPSRNFDNGVRFIITGPPLTGTTVDRWFLDFSAPFDAEVLPGFYADFQRWPFQDADRPGLAFGSTGRLDNRASGFFEILEASYGPLGEVLSFSVNFTHYGEQNLDRYAIVELRYNASMVPVPATLALLILGIGSIGYQRKRRTAKDSQRFLCDCHLVDFARSVPPVPQCMQQAA